MDKSRYLGILPVLFFANVVVSYVFEGRLEHVLWVCNVANLILAAGLFLRNAALIWVATLWLIAGTPMWLINSALIWDLSPHSLFTHLVSMPMGLWVMVRMPPPRPVWWMCTLYLLVMQLLAYLLSPAEPNINFAHEVYGPFKVVFSDYALFWLAMISTLTAGMFLMELGLRRIWLRRSL